MFGTTVYRSFWMNLKKYLGKKSYQRKHQVQGKKRAGSRNKIEKENIDAVGKYNALQPREVGTNYQLLQS